MKQTTKETLVSFEDTPAKQIARLCVLAKCGEHDLLWPEISRLRDLIPESGAVVMAALMSLPCPPDSKTSRKCTWPKRGDPWPDDIPRHANPAETSMAYLVWMGGNPFVRPKAKQNSASPFLHWYQMSARRKDGMGAGFVDQCLDSPHEITPSEIYALWNIAAQRSDSRAAQRLRLKSGNPDFKSISGNTLLHNANQQQTVRWLLSHGANPAARSDHGEPVIMQWVKSGERLKEWKETVYLLADKIGQEIGAESGLEYLSEMRARALIYHDDSHYGEQCREIAKTGDPIWSGDIMGINRNWDEGSLTSLRNILKFLNGDECIGKPHPKDPWVGLTNMIFHAGNNTPENPGDAWMVLQKIHAAAKAGIVSIKDATLIGVCQTLGRWAGRDPEILTDISFKMAQQMGAAGTKGLRAGWESLRTDRLRDTTGTFSKEAIHLWIKYAAYICANSPSYKTDGEWSYQDGPHPEDVMHILLDHGVAPSKIEDSWGKIFSDEIMSKLNASSLSDATSHISENGARPRL